MKDPIRNLFTLFISFLISFSGSGQTFQIKQFSIEEGFPYSVIQDFDQSAEGELIILTKENGLIMYDGHSFSKNPLKIFKDQKIKSVLQGKGMTWYFTEKGFFHPNRRYRENAQFISFPFSPNTLFQEVDSTCLIGTDNGLFIYQNDTIQPSQNQVLKNLQINKILDFNNDLILATSKGLLKYDKGRIEYLSHSEIHLSEIIPLNKDLLLLIDIGGKSWLWDRNDKERLLLHILEDHRIQIAAKTTSGQLILFTKKGKVISNKTGYKVDFRELTSNERLLPRNIFADSFGNLWLDLENGMLTCMQFTAISESKWSMGYGLNRAKKTFTDSKGKNWFYGNIKGLKVLDQNRVLNYDLSSGFSNEPVLDITEDKQGIIWVLNMSNELYSFDLDGFQKVKILGPGKNKVISAISSSNSHQIYFGSIQNGIYSITPSRSGAETAADVLHNDTIIDQIIGEFYLDKSGNRTWYWGFNGFGFIENEKKAFQVESFWRERSLHNMIKLGRYYLISTRENGLFWMSQNHNSWQIHPVDIPKLKGPIIDFIELPENRVLMMAPTKLHLFYFNNGVLDLLQVYDKQDGIDDFPFQKGSFGQLDNGIILVKSGSKLFEINPEFTFQNESLNPVSIYEITGSEKLTYLDQPAERLKGQKIQLQLSPWENFLEISFKSVHLSRMNEIQYQWRISSNGIDWSNPQTENKLSISQFDPGIHLLELRACLDGICSTPTSIEIHKEFPFWNKQKRAIILFLLGCLTLLILLLIQRKVLNRKARKLEERINREREKIRLEQQALQMQMNPHFLFNALNAIKGDIHPNSIKEARYNLSKFSSMVRKVLEYSRKSFITLEQEISLLEEFIQIHQMLAKEKFNYSINIDERLNPITTKIPPMLIQPIVENAIQHGIKNISNGLIQLNFIAKGKWIQIDIIDNGVGFRTDSASLNHQSISLSVCKKRLEMINKGKRKQDSLSIQRNPEGEGIKITLYLEWNET